MTATSAAAESIAPVSDARAAPAADPVDAWLAVARDVLERASSPSGSARARSRLATRFTHHLDEYFASSGARGSPPAAVTQTLQTLQTLVGDFDAVLHDRIVPALAASGVRFHAWDELSGSERARLAGAFRESIHPLLTPMAVDATHPFPCLPTSAVNVGGYVRDPHARDRFVCVTVPPRVPRLLVLGDGRYVTVETVLGALLPSLFAGLQVVQRSCFRVTRGAGGVTRLEVERDCTDRMLRTLVRKLGVPEQAVHQVRTSLAMGAAFSRWEASS